MPTEWTDTDFEALSWHDNAVHGLRLDPADPDAGDWRSDLVLSIDHIVEWVRQPDGRMRFSVAPARLTFHDVGALTINVDWQGEMLHDMTIDRIERAPADPVGPERNVPRFHWRIRLNWPDRGSLSFKGSGFRMMLLAEPVLLDTQAFSPTARRQFVATSRG